MTRPKGTQEALKNFEVVGDKIAGMLSLALDIHEVLRMTRMAEVPQRLAEGAVRRGMNRASAEQYASDLDQMIKRVAGLAESVQRQAGDAGKDIESAVHVLHIVPARLPVPSVSIELPD